MHCKLNEPISARRKRRKTRQQITTDFDWLRTCRETFESITRHLNCSELQGENLAETFWKNAVEHKFQISVSATASNKVISNTLLLCRLFQT